MRFCHRVYIEGRDKQKDDVENDQYATRNHGRLHCIFCSSSVWMNFTVKKLVSFHVVETIRSLCSSLISQFSFFDVRFTSNAKRDSLTKFLARHQSVIFSHFESTVLHIEN